jgi:hypothetical protein
VIKNKRKKFIIIFKYKKLIILKIKSFKIIKEFLLILKFLIYFSLNRVFYIKINSLLKYNFKIIIFYFKVNYQLLKDFIKIAFIIIKLILFLNKLLNLIKYNYYFIKFKIIYLIYIYRRL